MVLEIYKAFEKYHEKLIVQLIFLPDPMQEASVYKSLPCTQSIDKSEENRI